jgi:hypothetical protein
MLSASRPPCSLGRGGVAFHDLDQAPRVWILLD